MLGFCMDQCALFQFEQGLQDSLQARVLGVHTASFTTRSDTDSSRLCRQAIGNLHSIR